MGHTRTLEQKYRCSHCNIDGCRWCEKTAGKQLPRVEWVANGTVRFTPIIDDVDDPSNADVLDHPCKRKRRQTSPGD